MDMKNVTISNVKTNLAWITFRSANTVKLILRKIVENNFKKEHLDFFPNIGRKPLAIRTSRDNLMKRLRVLNKF